MLKVQGELNLNRIKIYPDKSHEVHDLKCKLKSFQTKEAS